MQVVILNTEAVLELIDLLTLWVSCAETNDATTGAACSFKHSRK